MNCRRCQQNIPDGVRFCPLCGANQQEDAPKIGVLILGCQHCYETGECKKGKTYNREHSCEYCVSKSGIKPASLFPHVPCSYCGGKGKYVIDLKIEKPQQQQKKKGQENG